MVEAGTAVARVRQQLIEVSERHPELAVENEIQAAEKWRRDANHGELPSGQPYGLSDDAGVGPKAAFPKAMPKHGHCTGLFVAQEAAPDCHWKLRGVKEVGGDGLPPHALGLAA